MKTEYVGAFTVEQEKAPEPTEVRVPLKKPLPLIACCCAKTPCTCWYGLAAKALAQGKRPFEIEAIVKRGALGGRKR